MNENLKLPTPLIYVRQGCRSTSVVTNATARSTSTCRHYRYRRREGQTRTQTMQTLWCVLRRDTTSVDTARVRRRLRLWKHYGAYYGKTRQASTPRGSDADLKYYENTEVEISRKPRGWRYKLVDIMTSV